MGGERERLIELAERCEKARGPDPELDAEIASAVLTDPCEVRLEGSPVAIQMWRYPDGSVGSALRFTASLDAALSLVRRTRCFIAALSDIAADGLPGCCLCVSTDPVREVWGVSAGGGNGPDERLARAATAAALRARAEAQP